MSSSGATTLLTKPMRWASIASNEGLDAYLISENNGSQVVGLHSENRLLKNKKEIMNLKTEIKICLTY
jgi:hypothetical protein